MASLQFDAAAQTYRVRFRFAGKGYFRSLKTASQRDAEARCGAVEKTIRALEEGYLTVPPGIDPGDFILSDGRLTGRPVIDLSPPAGEVAAPSEPPASLGQLFETYEKELPPGAKESNSLDTESIHRRHLASHFGADLPVAAIDHNAIQGYVTARSKAGRDPVTIRKELATLRMIWNWGLTNRQVAAPLPWRMRDLRFPKSSTREPFQTWAEIEQRIRRDRLEGEEAVRLWECLYLDEGQIKDCLEHVRERALYSFIHPMFCFAAYTGARRGEILRSVRDDFRFDSGTVGIRQKKSDRAKHFTFRSGKPSPKPSFLTSNSSVN